MTLRLVSNLNPTIVVSGNVTMSGGIAQSITGNTAGTAALISSGTMYLAGGNNVTLSQSGNTVSINAGGGTGGGAGSINLSAGTTSQNLTNFVMADSNGLAFGLSGSTITGSYTTPTQTVQTQNLHNLSLSGNTAGVMAHVSSGTATLAGGNNITLSQNGNAVTISGPNTVAQTQFVLSNSNGVSFGTNGSTVTATVRTDYQSAGAYLTTAMQSNNPVVQSINGSSGTFSLNTGSSLSSSRNGNAITFGLASNITTALQSTGNYLTTAAQSNHSHGNPTLALTNLSGTTASASNGLTISLSANPAGGADGVNILAAGTQTANTTGSILFTNSNGITFGMSNSSVITASHNGLTTAMASNRGTDFVQANAVFNGTNASGTIASNGISVSVNPAAAGVGLVAGTRTATTAGELLFDNANGVSFGLNAVGGSIMTASHNALTSQSIQTQNLMTVNGTQGNVTISGGNGVTVGNNASTVTISVATNYQSQGAYLTTAAQSDQVVNSINGSTGTFSFNTGSSLSSSRVGNAITFGLASNITTALQSAGAYLTTAMNSTTPIVQSINGSSGTFSFNTGSSLSSSRVGNAITWGLASNLSTAFQTAGNYLTTARASNDGIGLNTAQTNVTWTVNSSGISLNAGAYLTTAQPVGAYLTTARASTDAVGLNTAGTNVTWTVNSSGISLNAGAYLTTAAQSGHSHGNPTLALTNLNGTTASASNGFTLSLSAAAGGGVNPAASASNGAFNFTTLNFSDANNVTFGTSAGGIITASVAAPGAAAENNWVHALGANTAGNTTASGSTIGYSGINLTLSGTNGSVMNISAPATSSLSATGQLSISTNGNTISMGVPEAVTYNRYNEFKESPMVAGQQGNATLHIQPWLVPNLHMDRVVQHVQFSNASNSSNSFTISNWVGIYTRNVSTLSLLHSVSVSTNFSGSGTLGSYSLWGGVGYRGITAGLTQTLTEGMYWLGVLSRTSANAAGQTLNQMLNSNVNSTYSGLMGVATNATNQVTLGLGAYTASTSAMPDSIAFTQINGASSIFLRPPSLYFVSGTI